MTLTPTQDLDVVVIGEAVVTLTAEQALGDAESLARSQSGEGVIAAVQASRLGAQTALVTRVGDDAWGDWLLESWEDEGLHLDFARRVHGRNALTIQSHAEATHRAIHFRDGAVAKRLDSSDIEAVPWQWSRVLYATGSVQALGASVRDAVVRAFETARSVGVMTVYNPTLRAGLWPNDSVARSAFEELLALTDVLSVVAPFATGKLLSQASATEAARRARRYGIERVFVREGARGVVIAHGDVVERIDSAQGIVRGVDPSWSAAAFDGALCVALARRSGPREAAELALRAMSGCGRHDRPGFERLVAATDLGL